MKRILGCLLVVVAVIGLAACAAEEPVEQAVEVAIVEEAASGQITVIDLEMVMVAADGTVFEVAVQPEQIPAGAWYCDMGTVHYAQMDEGDGNCATCGMKLVEKVAAVDHEGSEVNDEAGAEQG